MGADLYIQSIQDKARAEHEPEFKAAVAKRDRAKTAASKARWQAKVDAAYNAMFCHGNGYFRDSYNAWNLSGRAGFSWWKDVVPLLDDSGFLPVEHVAALRERVAGAVLVDTPLSADDRMPDLSQLDDGETFMGYLQGRRNALVAFLDQALAMGEAPLCSL